MTMRRSIPLLLISLMLFQTASMLVMDSAEATSGRGGSNDDFQLFRITVGNSTDSANTWVQSDQSTIDYIVVGDEIEINVEIKRLGNSQIGRTATGTIDIVHPIGFVIESYSWTTDEMVAGQIKTGSYTWMPMIAHSILNTTTNDLTGGLIIRASVFYSGDDRNENDVLEQTVPVAVMKDSFDGTTLSRQYSDIHFWTLSSVVAGMQLLVAVGKPIQVAQLELTTGAIQLQGQNILLVHMTVWSISSSLQTATMWCSWTT